MKHFIGWKLILVRMVVALLSVVVVLKLDQVTGELLNNIGKTGTALIVLFTYFLLGLVNYITCIKTSEDLEDEVCSDQM